MSDEDNTFIDIKSEAYPQGRPYNIINISDIHNIIIQSDKEPSLDDVYYKKLSVDKLEEIMVLHKEWFPVNYNAEYFINILGNQSNSGYMAVGAFININKKERLIGNWYI